MNRRRDDLTFLSEKTIQAYKVSLPSSIFLHVGQGLATCITISHPLHVSFHDSGSFKSAAIISMGHLAPFVACLIESIFCLSSKLRIVVLTLCPSLTNCSKMCKA
jgi:hypothetical protein